MTRRRDTFPLYVRELLAWSRATFPAETPLSIARHLRREADEVVKAVEAGDLASAAVEAGDCIGLAVKLIVAYCAADPLDVLWAKLDINKRRSWSAPDADGVVEHVRSGERNAP